MSLRSQQSARAAADYASDRHDPRFAHYREAADATPLDAEQSAVLRAAVDKIDRAMATSKALRWEKVDGRWVTFVDAEAARQAVVVKASLYLSQAA